MKRIVMLTGGPSPEATVARESARAVTGALEARGYSVRVLELEPAGVAEVLTGEFDAAFLALHGRPGEDGGIQGMLDLAGLPYTFSGAAASALAIDKQATRAVFREAGIPVAQGVSLCAQEARAPGAYAALSARLGRQIFLKERFGGSSVGTRLVEDASAFAEWQSGIGAGTQWVAESRVVGMEVSVAVWSEAGLAADGEGDAETPRVLGAVGVAPASTYYSYEQKYQAQQTRYSIPPDLSPELLAQLEALALLAHRSVGCRSISRSDFIVTESHGTRGDASGRRVAGIDAASLPPIVALETNTIPGLTPQSLVPKLAAAHGIDFGTLCERLLREARTH